MSDGLTTDGGAAVADQGTPGTAGIVVDKNKTAEQYIADAEAKYIIPKLVREKFADLVKLIYETESMNEEEREYWMQIMPIMTEEQIQKFRDILVNERDQLMQLDAEYEEEMQRINERHQKQEINEAEMKERMQNIKEEEEAANIAEKSEEEALLKQLEELDQ